ncbi:MAG: ribosome silencing factor [Ilumatobacteraceae bacterium]
MSLDLAALALAVTCARACDDKLATDVVVLPVGDVIAVTEFFVVASASNPRQVRAVTDEVLRRVRDETGRGPLRSEGTGEQQWVLIDYGEVVVHVFAEETRRFYEIERLYRDVVPVDWKADPGS